MISDSWKQKIELPLIEDAGHQDNLQGPIEGDSAGRQGNCP